MLRASDANGVMAVICHSRHRQHGAALLLMLLVFGSLSLYYLLGRSSAEDPRLRRNQQTAAALAEAKAAIINWATLSATHTSAPGLLPCPENIKKIGVAGREGEARPSCVNSAPLVGRLPWRTLKLPELLDGNGNHLWYALSPGFRYPPINSNSPPGLSIDGGNTMAVAIIFSPGAARAGQRRRSVIDEASAPQVEDYLDGENADGDAEFASALHANVNDVLLTISHQELFERVEQRVLGEVAIALWTYYCGKDNTRPGGGCLDDSTAALSAVGGTGYFPYAADFTDQDCQSRNALADNECGSVDGMLGGRLPANPRQDGNSLEWQTVDAASILRGTLNDLVPGTTTRYQPDWFQDNGWRELIYYRLAAACAPGSYLCNGGAPDLAINKDRQPSEDEQKAVLLGAGIALSGQTRGSVTQKTLPENYFEVDNLDAVRTLDTQFTGSYPDGAATVASNDRPRGLH